MSRRQAPETDLALVSMAPQGLPVLPRIQHFSSENKGRAKILLSLDEGIEKGYVQKRNSVCRSRECRVDTKAKNVILLPCG
jgi:hypothetical protein